MKIEVLVILCGLMSLVNIRPAAAWPSIYPTGTTFYDPKTAHPGYILYAPLGHPKDDESKAGRDDENPSHFYLINMSGEVVHRWTMPYFLIHGRLLPSGNLEAIVRSGKKAPGRPGFGKFWMGGAAGLIVQLTWDGQMTVVHEDLNMHHDFVKLPNGHYLYLAWERVPSTLQAKVRGGVKGSEFPGGVMFNDVIVEIDAQGKTVWTWHANQHLDPDIDIIGAHYKREEWCHGNALSVLDDGNIVLTSRSTDSVIIISKKNKKIISRWGNTAYLNKKTGQLEFRAGPNALGGPHDAAVIPKGLPGAGNLLCYDNGLYTGSSRVIELDLKTRQIVWQSKPFGLGRLQFSYIMGGAQRLANGNTLICDGANGRFSQITPQNQLAWEYVNPHAPNPRFEGVVFRVHHYPRAWCPQFQKLPLPTGAAVLPPSNNAFRVASQAQGSTALPSRSASALPIVGQIAVLITTAALAFVLGRRIR